MPLTDQVKLLQKVAIIHQGKLLIMKRSEDATHRPGAWDLPGGNAEWPEANQSVANLHRQDVAREILEETGLVVEADHFTDENLVHFMTFFDADQQLYAVICGWKVVLTAESADIILSDEHTEFAWITLADLANYDLAEPKGTFIKHIIHRALKD